MEEEHSDLRVERSMYIHLQWILLLVRIVLAIVMIYYGWPKIRDLASNANDFVQMGFNPGIFWEHSLPLSSSLAAWQYSLAFMPSWRRLYSHFK